jgi:hypothetical protein
MAPGRLEGERVIVEQLLAGMTTMVPVIDVVCFKQ